MPLTGGPVGSRSAERHAKVLRLDCRADARLYDVVRQRWSDLSPRTRRFVIVAGAVEGALKAAALVDLARRPASQVRGSKVRWVVAIIVINSAGLVPVAYFVRGRLRH